MKPHPFHPKPGNQFRFCDRCDMTQRHPNHQPEPEDEIVAAS